MNVELQILLSSITVIGAGISVFVGIRVGLAELRRDLRALEKDLQEVKDRELTDVRSRITRLEGKYFN